MEKILEVIYQAVLDGNQELVRIKVKETIEIGLGPEQILHKGLILPMTEVGLRCEKGDFFVPEMLIAARAMKAGLEILKPLLVDADVPPAGKIVIGTVDGDHHDIGKNLVSMMLEGAGFEINDLGVDIPPAKFVQTITDNKVDILALSALLTTTLPSIGATISSLTEAGLRDQIKVIIGGAPVTPEYAEKIGADGYAPNASQAVILAKKLMS